VRPQTQPGRPGWRPAAALPPRETRLLSEAEAKALLAAAGVAVPRAVTAPTLGGWMTGGLTAPYALKGLGFAHKTEAGAVRLGLATLAGQAEMPGATGYLAEEMVTGAVAEVLLGLPATRSMARR
jgi:acetate---CoA ligase (ADP-forming)